MKLKQSIHGRIFFFTLFCLMIYSMPAYSDKELCIDAGHGYPDRGTLTPLNPYYNENDINLEVTLILRDSLTANGWLDGIHVKYIRTTDTFYERDQRALMANRFGAKAFVSIHHNSHTSSVQGSESFWCSNLQTQDGTLDTFANKPRSIDDSLALKILKRVVLAFKYNDRGHKDYPWDVLAQTTMTSALIEASFVGANSDPAEAGKFYNDPNGLAHTGQEAGAIFRGWESWKDKQGLALVDYDYHGKAGADPTSVWMNGDTLPVPYESDWLYSELIELSARDFSLSFNKTGATQYPYTFHHWEHRSFNGDSVIQTFTVDPLQFFVDYTNDNVHYYTAVFTGGPFDLVLNEPPAFTTAIKNSSPYLIKWNAPAGARESCSLTVAYSINNGSTWTQLIGPVKYNYGSSPGGVTGQYSWNITGIVSNTCKLRFIAWDKAENRDTLISHTFAVQCFKPVATFTASPTSGNPPRTVQFTDQSTWQPTSWLWNFGDGTTSTLKNPSHTYTVSGLYSVRLTATNECGGDDTLRTNLINVNCNVKADFIARTPTTGMDSVVAFVDDFSTPQFYGTAYLWDFGDGTTSNTMYGVTHAWRTPGKYNVKLTVTFACGVDDTTKIGFVHVLCCKGIRGNVNHDANESINVADVTYLTEFLYHGGPAPWCKEEANANGSAGENLNISDVTYLTKYLFNGGPPPPSCPATSAEVFADDVEEGVDE
jgi:PKD repeat protein